MVCLCGNITKSDDEQFIDNRDSSSSVYPWRTQYLIRRHVPLELGALPDHSFALQRGP